MINEADLRPALAGERQRLSFTTPSFATKARGIGDKMRRYGGASGAARLIAEFVARA